MGMLTLKFSSIACPSWVLQTFLFKLHVLWNDNPTGNCLEVLKSKLSICSKLHDLLTFAPTFEKRGFQFTDKVLIQRMQIFFITIGWSNIVIFVGRVVVHFFSHQDTHFQYVVLRFERFFFYSHHFSPNSLLFMLLIGTFLSAHYMKLCLSILYKYLRYPSFSLEPVWFL